jgi:hypothetical protein
MIKSYHRYIEATVPINNDKNKIQEETYGKSNNKITEHIHIIQMSRSLLHSRGT